jgi:hypothetical protein
MDGQPAWARERERTSQTPYKLARLPDSVSVASNRRDANRDSPRGEFD